MTKSKLMEYVGKNVQVYFKNSENCICGILGYADCFSKKYDYRTPKFFYIENYCLSFKASHIKTLVEKRSDKK